MIRIRECADRGEEQFFWDQLRAYFERDMFPDKEDEDRDYFLSLDYQQSAAALHVRRNDRLRYLIFERDGEKIGFVMATIYDTEDHRCYLMEFCVLPEFRGNGTGRACAREFEKWAYGEGAEYIELNAHTEQTKRFWKSVGYVDNGWDDWGDPLFMLLPKKRAPFSAEKVRLFMDWQLVKLTNGLRMEQGHPKLTEDHIERVRRMVTLDCCRAWVVKRGWRYIGICFFMEMDRSVSMYVEPAFRNVGAEELLRRAVRQAGIGI